MPSLLYCVTLVNESVNIATGVCDSDVRSQEVGSLRVYWSEIGDPEACLGDAESMRKARSQFQEVLRQVLSVETLLPFPFPTLLKSIDQLVEYVSGERETYYVGLEKIGDAVQYEIVACWPADEQLDLATPVKGGEYVKRRRESAQRIAAVDSKLRSVTGNSVREWRARQERRTHRWYALVPRKDRERFVASLRSASPSEGVRLRLSGPWPPVEFASANDGQ